MDEPADEGASAGNLSPGIYVNSEATFEKFLIFQFCIRAESKVVSNFLS